MTRTERVMVARVVREIRAIKRMVGRPDNQKVRQFVGDIARTSLAR